jgi:hypothetical protein
MLFMAEVTGETLQEMFPRLRLHLAFDAAWTAYGGGFLMHGVIQDKFCEQLIQRYLRNQKSRLSITSVVYFQTDPSKLPQKVS